MAGSEEKEHQIENAGLKLEMNHIEVQQVFLCEHQGGDDTLSVLVVRGPVSNKCLRLVKLLGQREYR
jgi:hypothetical protein